MLLTIAINVCLLLQMYIENECLNHSLHPLFDYNIITRQLTYTNMPLITNRATFCSLLVIAKVLFVVPMFIPHTSLVNCNPSYYFTRDLNSYVIVLVHCICIKSWFKILHAYKGKTKILTNWSTSYDVYHAYKFYTQSSHNLPTS